MWVQTVTSAPFSHEISWLCVHTVPALSGWQTANWHASKSQSSVGAGLELHCCEVHCCGVGMCCVASLSIVNGMSVLIGTPSAIPALWGLSNFPEVDMVRFAGVELRGVDDPRRVRGVASVFVFPSLPLESSDVAERHSGHARYDTDLDFARVCKDVHIRLAGHCGTSGASAQD